MNGLSESTWAEVFRVAVESSPNALVMVDHEGRIALVNSQTEELFGYTREELLGQPVEILAPPSAAGHADLRRIYLSRPQVRPVGAGRPLQGKRKDGSLVPIEIGLTPIQTEAGTWVLSLIVDITERKRVEQTLRESEGRFRAMADMAPIMLWIAGPDKLCTFFNKGWLTFTGRTIEQELGEGWTEGVHPSDRQRCTTTYTQAFEIRRDFQMEYRLRRADGEYRRVLAIGSPRFMPDRSFAGYIGSCMDITDMRRAQEEELARQKLESIGVLAGGIAHDFNNLLGSIIADAELALAEMASGSSCEEEVQSIRTVALRASEIVRELMIYAGQDKAHLEPVDVSHLVDEMLHLLKISITKSATLKTDLGSDLPRVLADAAQLRQVVMNLILNASEAIGEMEGSIEVKTSRVTADASRAGKTAKSVPEGTYLLLEVSDTGRGMSEEVMTRIFDPFFTTKLSGRGLGLGVVQSIVNRNGGAIHVTSKLGHGARFEILLPCVAANSKKKVSPSIQMPVNARNGASATVLLVEDEEGLRLAVSKMLRKRGFKVLEAGDASTAIALFQRKKKLIDVILLDITLPGVPSREVLTEVARARPEVKVILTTAYSREMAASLDAAPVKGFIRKPYQIDDLIRQIREVLGEGCDSEVASG